MLIGAFSKYVKTTVKTLRYYDRIGLFGPAYTDPASGYRNYTLEQVSDFEKIRQYRAAGLSVDRIKRLLGGENQETILSEQQNLLNEQERILQQQKDALKTLLNAPSANNYAISLKNLPAYTVCTYRTRIADTSHILPVISERFNEMKKQYPNFSLVHPNYCCITFTDASHRDTDIEIEYAEAVTEAQENKNGFIFKNLPGGTVACVEHYGRYENISAAYAALFRWLTAGGYRAAGAVRERFIHGKWDRKNEADWLVEIQIPLQKPGGAL